jgi:hypothetical protein
MYTKVLASVAACALAITTVLAPTAAISAPILYSIDRTITSANPTGNPLQSNRINGSITTDGTIGIIQTSNILSYSLNLMDLLNSANNVLLTPANSTVVLNTGSALIASAINLSFDYTGSGEFLIQANSPGPFSGYSYFCFSTGAFACLRGETISPQNIFADGAVATGVAAPIGVQPLGPPISPVTPVPEPTTLVLFGTALCGLALMRRRRLI